MRIQRLRNKLLLSAFVISILTALAYMSAVSWVIRGQYLEQSTAVLNRAQRVITDTLAERQSNMLAASRQLATRKNLGSTLWYLAQYAKSEVDHATLLNTYQQLARSTYETGHIAQVSKIALYNSTGALVTFALFDDKTQRYGFAESYPVPRFQVATLKAGEEKSDGSLRLVKSIDRLQSMFQGALPQKEGARYAVVDGAVSIETFVPVMGLAFDPISGVPQTKQLGLVVMVDPLDQSFVSQLVRLTDTSINVFTPQGFSSGSLAAYRKPDWGGVPAAAVEASSQPMLLNEIAIQGAGYYQGLIPLKTDQGLAGYIATLRSKEVVRGNTLEMIRILLLIAAASLVFVIPFAWYFATSISQPLATLSRIFRGVARGERSGSFHHELDSLNKGRTWFNEVGDLTQSFVAMKESINQKIHQINEINASLEQTIQERTSALVAKEQETRTLIENSQDAIARYDRQCRCIFVNPALTIQAGCRPDELLGKRPTDGMGSPHVVFFEAKLKEVLSSGHNAQFELKWISKDGRQMCSHVQLTAETDPTGQVVTVLAVGRDISDRLEFEATIWKQANFDPLTNLPNRRMFYDRLEQETKIMHRSGRAMALMLIDLDHFKEINDTLGHDTGDVLLIEAARRITSCLRETDTVARLGGDEFTIILPDLNAVASIERIAQDILSRLTEPFKLGENIAYISASVGITLYPDDATDLDVLFKNVDQAMYAAKNAGRNRFSYFTPDLQVAAQKRLRLAHDLRAALAGEQFQVYYQPIVDLESGQIYKAEAVLRWQHPDGGLIHPKEFIPLAEETGLIVPIGDWLFKMAVQQAIRWRSQYHALFQISVNTSPVQIRYGGNEFAAWLDHLREYGLPGQCIAIEITESMLLNAESKINEKLLKFRDAGIQVAIDDFGTGYSSLAYLKRFDIDYLKIDRSFVHNLEADSDDLALCEAIIVMAHKLGLKVIAEGVETAEQRDLLAAAGCDFAQGFLYSQPVQAEAFEKLLQPFTTPPILPA